MPKISDSQRSKVFSAEKQAEKLLRIGPADIDDVESIADLAGIEMLIGGDGTGTRYFHDGHVEVGKAATLPGFLHVIGHHLTPRIFPAHGVEWVQRFYGLLETHTDYLATYEEQFTVHSVRQTIDALRKRARKDAVYFTNKECGCLGRVLLDDPPQDHVCQLVAVEGQELIVLDDEGEFSIDLERVRYVSASLSKLAEPS